MQFEDSSVPSELQKTGRNVVVLELRGGLLAGHRRAGDRHVRSHLGLSVTFRLPNWLNQVTYHTAIPRLRGGLQRVPRHGRGRGRLLILATGRCARKRTRRSSCCVRKGLGRRLTRQGTESVPVFDEGPRRVEMEQRHATRASGQVHIFAQHTLPVPAFGHEGPDDDGLGIHAADQPQGGGQRGTVEMTSSTTATRRPRTTSTRAGSIRRRCGVSVVME